MRFSLIWQFFICFLYKIKALNCNSYEYIIICKNKEVLLHYFNYLEHKYHICLNLKTAFEGFWSLWELQNTSDQAQMWAHSQWIFLNDCVTRLTQTSGLNIHSRNSKISNFKIWTFKCFIRENFWYTAKCYLYFFTNLTL